MGKQILIRVTAGLLALGFLSVANTASIANGSFELATAGGSLPSSGGFAQQNTSTNDMLAWNMDAGSVDWIHKFYLGDGVTNMAYDGDYFLDMNGANLGTISSVISGLAIGQTYQLSFAMSGNPTGPSLKTMDVKIGTATQGYSFDYVTAGITSTDLQWEVMTFGFVASAETEALTVMSTTASTSFYGPLIDGMTVTAVPLPMAAWLFSSALGLLGWVRVRARNITAT